MYLTAFCFDLESLDGLLIGQLIREAHFRPTQISANTFFENGGKFTDKLIERIERDQNISHVEIATKFGDNGPSLEIFSLPSWGMQVVYWTSEHPNIPPVEYFNGLTSLIGFNVGYRTDADDLFWQSETRISTYKVFSKPFEHLPKAFDPDFEEEIIDVSHNPGRRSPFPGMWLQASWQMWFGYGSARFIPHERLRSFQLQYGRMEELPSGAIFIQLYEKGEEYGLKENRLVQKRFREWIGMNELEQQAAGLAELVADPIYEFWEGKYPHGGQRLIWTWLDCEGKPVRKSHASKRMSIELGEHGKELWREIVEP